MMIVSPILFLANVVRRAYGRRRTVESLPHERGVDQTPATNIAGVGPTSESVRTFYIVALLITHYETFTGTH